MIHRDVCLRSVAEPELKFTYGESTTNDSDEQYTKKQVYIQNNWDQ